MDTGLLNSSEGAGDENVPIVMDAWAEIQVDIDLNANTVSSYYNGTPVASHHVG